MKIYCSTDVGLDKYVGKDVWVLCEFMMSTRHNRKPHWSSARFWVRFLSKIPGGYEINTSVATSNIDGDYDYLLRVWDNLDYNHQTAFSNEIRAVEPVEVLGR